MASLLADALYLRRNPNLLRAYLTTKRRQRDGQPRLRVAVLGLGGAGTMHISHYLANPHVEVRAVFAPSEEEFGRLKRRFPFLPETVRYSAGYEALCEAEDVDIVSICLPDHLHAPAALRALEAGKHVLCEKPMATSLEDCQRIVRAADAASRRFMVFQQMRFVPLHGEVKRLIAEERLGKLFYASCGYIHDMSRRASEFSRWRLDSQAFQHPILGGCHHIDLLRWLVGEVVEVYTVSNHLALPSYPTDDCFVTSLRFESGAVGDALTAFGPRVSREFHPLRVYGTGGTVMDDILFEDGMQRAAERRLAAAPYRGFPDFRSTIDHFVDAARGLREPMVSARDGAATVAACLAAIASARSGRPEAVPRLNA